MRAAKLRVGVVGLGAIGSAAVFHLARRGAEVVGLEQFGPAHELGSSHGESRIIRQAYFEDPCYVPLVLRAYELWQELERDSGESILTTTGGLMIGSPETDLVSGALASAEQWGLQYELLTAGEIHSRFPAIDLESNQVGVFEAQAGYLAPELAVMTHLRRAASLGAHLSFGEAVLGWEEMPQGIHVRTIAGSYWVDRLVLAGGAWTTGLLNGWELPLQVERQVMGWFAPSDVFAFDPMRFPIYLFQQEEGHVYYGFPSLDGLTVKGARHHGGEITTPERLQRSPDRDELAALRTQLGEVIPGLRRAEIVRAKVCMYTDTPDLNFAIGLYPESSRVAVGCGFSGHGFKFSPVLGEILADLVETGTTAHSIDPLSAARFG